MFLEKRGSTMSRETRHIKKLMGWCPNAKTNEARRHLNIKSFENFEANSREGREKAEISETLYGYRRVSTRIFLINASLTLLYPIPLTIIGLKHEAFLAGLIISILIGIFDWKKQMKRYGTLEKEPVLDYSSKVKLLLFKKWHGIPGYIFLLVSFYLWSEGKELALPFFYSFFAGSIVFLWLAYLQTIYWERKNHKTIYYKSCGTWKTAYVVRERK